VVHVQDSEEGAMSLDIYLSAVRPTTVYSRNITHNLNRMATEAGIYEHLWRPDEICVTKAAQLIEPLKAGLALLLAEPERFRDFNPANGWGSYEGLVEFVQEYLSACEENPDADVSVWR
jgi:hypothetical protein